MTKVKNIFILFIFAILATIFFFFYSGSYIPLSLDSQLDNIIKTHDVKTMQKIALNKKTLTFLKHLSSKERVRNTSDFEGGDKNIYHYATGIKNKTIGVDMKKVGLLNWHIKAVSEE